MLDPPAGHHGDLMELKARLAAETPKDAKNAKVGTVGNHAKDAKPAFKDGDGNVGILPGADGNADRGYLAQRDPSAPEVRPPCDHPGCYDALLGRCLAGESVCSSCGLFLGATHTCTGEDSAA